DAADEPETEVYAGGGDLGRHDGRRNENPRADHRPYDEGSRREHPQAPIEAALPSRHLSFGLRESASAKPGPTTSLAALLATMRRNTTGPRSETSRNVVEAPAMLEPLAETRGKLGKLAQLMRRKSVEDAHVDSERPENQLKRTLGPIDLTALG